MLRQHRIGRFDVVHAFWAGAPGQVASAFAAIERVPAVVTLPGGDLARIKDIGYGAQQRLRSRLTTRLVLSRAAAIIVPSDWLAAQARAQGWDPIVCPFGIALDHWPPMPPRSRLSGAQLRLIHIGSLNRVKDQFGLLDALRLLADQSIGFTMDVIGEDTLGGAVQRHCRAIGLDNRVTFHGFLPNAGLRGRLEEADLLAMNSRHEGAPIALLEAAVAGVPTVGTAVGNIADWAPEAALVVPVQSPHALADAIAELSRNEPERLRLANAAHSRAVAHDADQYAAEIRSLYANLAAR
jgi:glycosyltransferase involved in cell wall biosynthesis